MASAPKTMSSDFFSNLRTQSFSVDLACSIGLDAAILLGHLLQYASGDWRETSIERLRDALPYWSEEKLREVWRQLVNQGIVTEDGGDAKRLRFKLHTQSSTVARNAPQKAASPIPENWQPNAALLDILEREHDIPREYALGLRDEFVLYWNERGDSAHSWGSKFRQHALGEWRKQQSRGNIKAIDYDWRPDAGAVSELNRRHGMNSDFIEDLIPTFISYWKEKDATAGTWSHKFMLYARKNWTQHQRLLEHDAEDCILPANWQPAPEVWDVLDIAKIDRDFAIDLLPEFRLYWRECAQMRSSWGAVFVAFIRRQWSKRQLPPAHAENFIQRHTDDDWRPAPR